MPFFLFLFSYCESLEFIFLCCYLDPKKLTSISTEWSQRGRVSGSFTRLVFWEGKRSFCSTVIAHTGDIGAFFPSKRIKWLFFWKVVLDLGIFECWSTINVVVFHRDGDTTKNGRCFRVVGYIWQVLAMLCPFLRQQRSSSCRVGTCGSSSESMCLNFETVGCKINEMWFVQTLY